jgi:hypothetical protein
MNLGEKIRLSLQTFARDYCENPFRFVFEADIDSGLYKHLTDEISEAHIIKRQLEKNTAFQEFDIGKVHMMYPGNLRFDIAILGDPVQWKHEDLAGKKNENFYEQPVAYAIETKLHAINEPNWLNVDNGYTDFKRLIDKMNKLKYPTAFKEGFVLNIFQTRTEMNKFLESYSPEEKNGWVEEFNEFREIYSRIKFLYVDLDNGDLKEVPYLSKTD